jgi:hypothetical protein
MRLEKLPVKIRIATKTDGYIAGCSPCFDSRKVG